MTLVGNTCNEMRANIDVLDYQQFLVKQNNFAPDFVDSKIQFK